MTTSKSDTRAVDDLVGQRPPAARLILDTLRRLVRDIAPEAQERVSYGMPSFFDHGVLIHFDAFKKHLGVYPPVNDPALADEVAPFAGPKGNLQFPLDRPVPYELIGRIVASRLRANRGNAAAKGPRVRRR